MRPPTEASAKERAWRAFSKFIRLRDPQCITCGKPTTEAGHYFHTSDKGTNPHLGGNEVWFNEKNVHGQEYSCNREKSGNLSLYTLYIEEKYGMGIVQDLRKLYNTPRKWTIEELLEIEKIYNLKCEKIEQ